LRALRSATRRTAAIGAIAGLAALASVRLLDLTLPASPKAATGPSPGTVTDTDRGAPAALAPAEGVGAEVAEADRLASHPLALLIFLALWAVPGLVAAVVIWWNGHDLRLWLVLGVGFGPIAAMCALTSSDGHGTPVASTLRPSAPQDGPVDVLVDADGPEVIELAEPVRRLAASLGDRLGRLTLARAVPHRTHERPDRVWDEEARALLELEELSARLDPLQPAIVLVQGESAEALTRYARAERYDTFATTRSGFDDARTPVTELADEAAEPR
jgi:hypothetical protein